MKDVFTIIALVLIGACANHEQEKDNESIVPAIADIKSEPVIEDEPFEAMDMFFKKLDVVPAELEYEGKIVDAWWWNDLNGENYFLRTIEEKENEVMEDGHHADDLFFYSQSLHTYHFVLTEENSELVLLRELFDFENDCDFDLKVEHMPTVSFNDADQDNYGEITFGYMLACRSDVSPSSYKVFTFENGEKYGLRGQSETMGFGGDYVVGDEFNEVSDTLLIQAIAYWEEHQVEFE